MFIDDYGNKFKDEEEVKTYAIRFFMINKKTFIQKVAETYSKEQLAAKLFNCYLNLDNLEQMHFYYDGVIKEAIESFIKDYLNNYCKKED
jgi:hypothetical protein